MAQAPEQPEAGLPPPGRLQSVLERIEGLMLIAGFGSFVLSFVALGVLPSIHLEGRIDEHTPAAQRSYTELEALGRAVYAREGCAYCHSQFVRPIASDVGYFGPPSEAWEYQNDRPHMLGTRRIGPDLARESGKRTRAWQYAHLYNPRSTVPRSIMPPYPWLFEDGQGEGPVPTREARALVAYLETLGRAMDEAGPQQARRLYEPGADYSKQEATP